MISGMVKAVSFFKRKAGMSVDAFQAYWRTAHPEVVVKLPGIRRYVQSHTLPSAYRKGEPVYDGIAELWFDDTGRDACPGRDRGIRDGPGGRGAVHRTLDHGPDHHRGARRQGRRRAGGRREERRIRDPQARDGGRPLPAVLVPGPRAPGGAHPPGAALRAAPHTARGLRG